MAIIIALTSLMMVACWRKGKPIFVGVVKGGFVGVVEWDVVGVVTDVNFEGVAFVGAVKLDVFKSFSEVFLLNI